MAEVLATKDVSKVFGGLTAVDNVSMSVNEGDIFGIIGPNGAGKTTFFNICSGIYKPTAGTITLCGENITGQSVEVISAKGLARTFQSTQLFKYMSVLENVKIGCHKGIKGGIFDAILHTKTYKDGEKYAEQKSLETLEKAGLLEYANVMAGNLPYGIQRKVEIARSLATDPKVMLLDEPAAGMNPQETAELCEYIQQLNRKGQTILLIEHDMKFVMKACNNIMVLNFGRKICEGSPEVVKNDEEVKKAYFGSGMLRSEVTKDAQN